jgi:hypothetical protein
MTTLSVGEEGFFWFFGVVEDIEDPLQVGRVRVRIYNQHNEDKNQMPKEALPWAMVLQSSVSAASAGIGISPTGIAVGSTVIGFFVDGIEKQIPFVLGTYAGIPKDNDVAQVARGKNSVSKEKVGPEPDQTYDSKYPHNKTMTTTSGHVIEIDDTPNAERIHIFHKSGSYVEMNQDGSVVSKAAGSDFDIVAKDKTIYVGGNANIEIGGNAKLEVGGTVDATVGGQVNIQASKVNIGCDVIVDGDVIASGISLTKHVHGGVDTGPGKTSKPQ